MILVTYFSVTGNTRRIAEAIYEVLPGEKQLLELGSVAPGIEHDLVFAGFPVMQFRPPRETVQFFKGLNPGQNLAIFVTHAMFPGSDDQAMNDMLEKVLQKCRNVAPLANLTGFFHCRGELAEPTARMLADSGIPLLQQFAELRKDTIGHPDLHDFDQARKFGLEVINKLRAK